MKKTTLGIVSTLLALSLGGCGGGGSGGGSGGTSNAGENLGAAVGSLFGDQDEASLMMRKSIPYRLVSLLVSEARAQGGRPTSACDVVNQGPAADITITPSVAVGTYGVSGSQGNFVTLTGADGCDQQGAYASFDVASHQMTCTDGNGTQSTVEMTNSTGVFTETGTASEIYGTFNVSAGGSSATAVQCHITITHTNEGNEGAADQFSAVCADSDGNAVAQATDVTCM